MPTAEPGGASAGAAVPRHARKGDRLGAEVSSRLGPRQGAWCALALILAASLGLRLWGIRQGLPYIYNIDEAGHFVPKAVQMFSHGLDPRYFVNPPALTYVLHLVFAVWLGGSHGVEREYALHPDQVYLLARVTVALLGTASVWVLYLVGARLFDRRAALLAAAIEAVAFLPVFYGHFALNDAATLLPLTLSLLGSAGILRSGRRRDYALAGIGLGLACASKYTAGIVIVPLAAAAAAQYLAAPTGAGRRAPIGLAIAGACALAAFLLANPYALLDFQRFHSELVHQSSLSDEAQGKLGAPKQGGLLYYLWSFTWGLGWAPALAALGGMLTIWRHDARIGWMLVPAPILFLAFMGLQDRYFGRWLLPIFPIACLLGAFFALTLLSWVATRVDSGRPARILLGLAGVAAVALLLAQGLVYSVHNDLVLARADTRNLTRAWLVAHVPRGAPIVLEPVVLNSWVEEGLSGSGAKRWAKYPALQSVITPDGRLAPQNTHAVALEDYETTLSPALIGWYERLGYCWVISGSTEAGRAFADPSAAPLAVAYYRALAAQAEVAYHVSPYAQGAAPPRFNFDWTFDYYPLSFHRPGPEMTVYRLRNGRCARGVHRLSPYPG
ncbi:MAG TPA: glycosyltransferase family 39 protein [Solirubrobacteraceae bacterium]|jgi:4-amino-4-deoxy-L-arabinose transferase-like glycosyltransferase|nr:glycosyltransferase family 39 protein [Solirubrobacteraceae bacterium]